MFCSNCGTENQNESNFCKGCGKPIYVKVITKAEEHSPEDIQKMFMAAQLKMQHESLKFQQQQMRDQQEAMRIQQKQLQVQQQQYNSMMRCPRCGSTSLSGNKTGFGVGKAVIGAALIGPIGLVAGNLGAKKVVVTCMKCGKKFKA